MTLRDQLRRHRGKIALFLAAAAVAAWFGYIHRGELNRETLMAFGQSLPAGWFIVAFFVLPLVGFPVSLFLLLTGIRFGLGPGMALSAAAVIFHHLAAFFLAHGWFRHPARHRLERAGYAIPPISAGHRAWFMLVFAAVRGPPYIAKLYLIALTDVPFRIYFWIGVPVAILFCLVPVGAGTALMSFDPTLVSALLALATTLLLAGYWLSRRWRSRNLPPLGK